MDHLIGYNKEFEFKVLATGIPLKGKIINI